MNDYISKLQLEPIEFVKEINGFCIDSGYNIDETSDIAAMGKMLSKAAGVYSYLSSLYSYANIFKRKYAKEGNKEMYHDMIDKEKILETTMKAIDLQYRAISKGINIYLDEKKELFYNDSIRMH